MGKLSKDGTFTLSGFEELQEMLSELPRKVVIRAGRKSFKDGAAVFQDAMKAKVPVRTGNLKESISVSSKSIKNTGIVITGVKGEYYGRFVEFGHFLTRGKVKRSRRGVKKKRAARTQTAKYLKYIEKQEFIRPAFIENKDKVIGMIAEDINETFSSAVQRYIHQKNRGKR